MPRLLNPVSSSPLQGDRDPQLSERRDALADAATLDSDDAIEKFRRDFTSMGLVDHIVDFFMGGDKADILAALALCHIASFPKGQEYLAGKGELADVGESQRYLLDRLTPTARDGMFSQAQCSASGGIVLTFPLPGRGGLGLVLRAGCFGDGAGAITPNEAARLVRAGHQRGDDLLSQLNAGAGSENWPTEDAAIALRLELLDRASSELTGKELKDLTKACGHVMAACGNAPQGRLAELAGQARALKAATEEQLGRETATYLLMQTVAAGSGPEKEMTQTYADEPSLPMEIWHEIDRHLGTRDRGALGLSSKGAAPFLAIASEQSRLMSDARQTEAQSVTERTAYCGRLLTAVGQLDPAHRREPLVALTRTIWLLPASEVRAYADILLTEVGQLDPVHRGEPLAALAHAAGCLQFGEVPEYVGQLLTAGRQLDAVPRVTLLVELAGRIICFLDSKLAYAEQLLTTGGQLDAVQRGRLLVALAKQIRYLRDSEMQAYADRLHKAAGQLDPVHSSLLLKALELAEPPWPGWR